MTLFGVLNVAKASELTTFKDIHRRIEINICAELVDIKPLFYNSRECVCELVQCKAYMKLHHIHLIYSMGQLNCKYCGAQNTPPPKKKTHTSIIRFTSTNPLLSRNESM